MNVKAKTQLKKKKVKCIRCNTLSFKTNFSKSIYYDYEFKKYIMKIKRLCNECNEENIINKNQMSQIRNNNEQLLKQIKNEYDIKIYDDTLDGDILEYNVLKNGLKIIMDYKFEHCFNKLKIN